WLQWLCTVAGWCSAGAVLYGSCHQQEVFSVADDARADTRTRFSAQYCDKGMPLVAHKVALAVMSAVNFCLASYSNRTYAPSSLSAPSDLAPLLKTISEVTSHALQRNNNLTALFLNTKLFSLLKLNSIVDNVESQVPTNDGNVTNNLPQVRQIVDASLIFSLLLKLVQPKNTDIQLGVSLLTLLSLKESLSILNELIKRLGFDYPRLEMVAEIGKSLCEIYSQVEMRARFEDMHKNARWGERFAEMNISFADYFGKHVAIFQNIFNVIVEHPNCSCSLLKDLCTDFNLSYTEAMLCFIRSLVSRGLPAPEDDLTITSSGWPAEQISQVTAGVEDKVLLREAFVKELSSVNSYHYDAIQFLLKQLAVLDQKESSEQDWHRGLEILQFLRTYERKSKPPSEELDEWNSKNPNSKSFPTIASKRLPFTELFEGSAKLVMKIIDGELDVLTIDSWLRCSDSLKLNQDQMCFVAVKNTVSRALVKKQYESNEPWQLTSCHSDLLKDVSVVISRIQHDKLAMACGQSVVKMLPHGADRVLCTHSCLLMARRWRDHSDTTEARDAVAKFTSEYQRLCAEQALHRHSLAPV
ncbi:kinetochore-associated protein 1, partial [Hyalella azteca]|uniref:Kinetochore-associated protein 1 n=1 Tax=Hyalella azteca TaxID=294128 RepID=A0A8B7NTE0_HYAAZ